MSAFREEIIGEARLFLADCREVVPTLGKVDAVVTDPPYGIGYSHGGGGRQGGASSQSYERNSKALAGDNEPFDPTPWLAFPEVILWGANHYAARLPPGRWLAFDKLAGSAVKDSFSDVEFGWSKGKGKDRIFSHLWKGLCQGSEFVGKRRHHPTQKPIALMRWCLEQLSGQTILDPYMGSGTTGVACMQLGRQFIGCEVDADYFDIACRRIEEAYRQPRLFSEPELKPTQPKFFGGETA